MLLCDEVHDSYRNIISLLVAILINSSSSFLAAVRPLIVHELILSSPSKYQSLTGLTLTYCVSQAIHDVLPFLRAFCILGSNLRRFSATSLRINCLSDFFYILIQIHDIFFNSLSNSLFPQIFHVSTVVSPFRQVYPLCC